MRIGPSICAALWTSTLLAQVSLAAEPVAEVNGPLSPQDSLRQLVLADGDLTVELAACEPEVIDPVAIKFDEDGRMWVAEMHDYPLGALRSGGGKRTEKEAEPMSRIKILEDADGDGRFEKATLFADKLSFVTGIQPWKGGVIVTLAGKVAYMKDTNGDGKADLDETWFTGFAEQNAQLRANHPTFALDNWVYVANGLRGGKVVNHLANMRGQETGDRGQGTNPKSQIPNPKSEISLSGMDFRFNPLTGEAEAVSGNGQFGMTFDDWGNRFICSNRNPCMHVVIENRYLQRAPNVAIPAVVQDVVAAAENSRIYPLTRAWTTSNLHAGQFTAACGVFIYRGDLLTSLRGNVFTCDPTGNLVHREIMTEKGPTFEGKPAYVGKEFLASRDEWFRPVSMQLGPDGALYIVDMYRAVIEHPEWVPDELKNRPDERLGDDRGRIYRIVPRNTNPKRHRGPSPKLSSLPSADLVTLLEHDNAWQRDTAQRLLIERQNPTVEEALSGAVADSARPLLQTHALWSLVGLNRLKFKPIAAAMNAEDYHVRTSALSAVQTLDVDGDRKLRGQVINRILLDQVSAIRLRAALVPFTHEAGREYKELVETVIAQCSDPWMRRMFLLTTPNVPEAVSVLAHSVDAGTPARRALLQEAIEVNVAYFGVDRAHELLNILLPSDPNAELSGRSRSGLLAMASALAKRRSSITEVAKAKVTNADERLKLATILASATAESELLQESTRIEAIQLLGYLPNSDRILSEFALREDLPSYRQAAIGSLARLDGIEPWAQLVERFPSESLQVRSAILDGIFQRPERIALLLDAIEVGTIRPAEIDRVQTDRLLKHGDAKIRERAAKIFGSATPADRQKALEDYQSVLAMNADAVRGRQVFAKNCATCHKIGEIGVNVAPDISDSRTKTPAQILGDIIQPNRAIDANYIAWNVLLTDGSSASGVLSAETGTSITLRQPEGKTLVVSRSDIEQLKSTGLSLMPEGLEKNVPQQDMADLIAFIKNWRYLDGLTPLKK
jgi:putative membrane-bound dehydrogenase-like protein